MVGSPDEMGEIVVRRDRVALREIAHIRRAERHGVVLVGDQHERGVRPAVWMAIGVEENARRLIWPPERIRNLE